MSHQIEPRLCSCESPCVLQRAEGGRGGSSRRIFRSTLVLLILRREDVRAHFLKLVFDLISGQIGSSSGELNEPDADAITDQDMQLPGQLKLLLKSSLGDVPRLIPRSRLR